MRASAAFVDHSLREAIAAAWPGSAAPNAGSGLRLCLGAGGVAPADWLCVDDSEDYPETTPEALRAAAMRCRGRARFDVTRIAEAVPAGLCSAVYAHHVLEHIPVALQPGTLRAWASLVAPGGWLYLCQPDLDALCARTLEAAHPGAAEPWFAADPHARGLPGEAPGARRGLPAGDLGEEMTSHYWLYLGGDHRSVPAEGHLRRALAGTGIELRRVRRDLRAVREDLRLFVSLEGCYIGRRTEAAS